MQTSPSEEARERREVSKHVDVGVSALVEGDNLWSGRLRVDHLKAPNGVDRMFYLSANLGVG